MYQGFVDIYHGCLNLFQISSRSLRKPVIAACTHLHLSSIWNEYKGQKKLNQKKTLQTQSNDLNLHAVCLIWLSSYHDQFSHNLSINYSYTMSSGVICITTLFAEYILLPKNEIKKMQISFVCYMHLPLMYSVCPDCPVLDTISGS